MRSIANRECVVDVALGAKSHNAPITLRLGLRHAWSGRSPREAEAKARLGFNRPPVGSGLEFDDPAVGSIVCSIEGEGRAYMLGPWGCVKTDMEWHHI
jgi:hypothetical protein